jgi:hypothetical protein
MKKQAAGELSITVSVYPDNDGAPRANGGVSLHD